MSARAGPPVRVFEATVVRESGRTGSLGRRPYRRTRPSWGGDFFKLTGTEGAGSGESFQPFPIRAGDYILADRGDATAPGVA